MVLAALSENGTSVVIPVPKTDGGKIKPPGEEPGGFYNGGNGVPSGTRGQFLGRAFVPHFRNRSSRMTFAGGGFHLVAR
jgi:hypothetical protein